MNDDVFDLRPLASVPVVITPVCQCPQPFLPIGGYACEHCGGIVPLDKLPAAQPRCGHPVSAIVSTADGMNYCAACEEEAHP